MNDDNDQAAAPAPTGDVKPDAAAYGRALQGFGINLLVRDVAAVCRFTTDILTLQTVYQDHDFAILRHGAGEWMVHSDSTYHSHPLLGVTPSDGIRGSGVELRVYGVDPDAASARASAAGYDILQPASDKPHGLREAYIIGPDYYIWVPSLTR